MSTLSLRDSITEVLAVKRSLPREEVLVTENSRINEKELYAASVHKQLYEMSPDLGHRFSQDLRAKIEELRESKGEDRFFSATNKLLRRFVKEKLLSKSVMKALRFEAFGKAQLDSDRSWLDIQRSEQAESGDTPVRAIKTALVKYAENVAASYEEVLAFREKRAVVRQEMRGARE